MIVGQKQGPHEAHTTIRSPNLKPNKNKPINLVKVVNVNSNVSHLCYCSPHRRRPPANIQQLPGDGAGAMDEACSEWDELRKEARRLEGELEVRLSSYAKLGGYTDSRSSAESMEMEIESLLGRLLDVNEALGRCTAPMAPASSVAQKLARHRDIFHEFVQEFKRTKGNITSIREHAELLTSVRNDINEYKASSISQAAPNLLRERAAIHGSVIQVDETTSQAESVKGALAAQRNAFTTIQVKVKQLGDKFPAIRGLLGTIKRKKSEDTLVLLAVIAVCTLFLIVYWITK